MKRIIRRIETAARLQSAISIIAIVFSSLAVAPAADAQDKGPTTIYVDCARHQEEMAPSARPYPTITAALDHAADASMGEPRGPISMSRRACAIGRLCRSCSTFRCA